MTQASQIAPDRVAKAAKCRQLAEKADDEQDRERWLAMERFWLKPTDPGEMTPED